MVIQMLKMKNMHIFNKNYFLSYQYHLESSEICSICQKNLSGLINISWKVDIWSFRQHFFCKSETVDNYFFMQIREGQTEGPFWFDIDPAVIFYFYLF